MLNLQTFQSGNAVESIKSLNIFLISHLPLAGAEVGLYLITAEMLSFDINTFLLLKLLLPSLTYTRRDSYREISNVV